MSEIISAIIGGAVGFGLFYVSFRLGRKSFERDLRRLADESRKKALTADIYEDSEHNFLRLLTAARRLYNSIHYPSAKNSIQDAMKCIKPLLWKEEGDE